MGHHNKKYAVYMTEKQLIAAIKHFSAGGDRNDQHQAAKAALRRAYHKLKRNRLNEPKINVNED